ncbi:MAG: hypothetical protein WC562_09515 [Dehalococcoidia bacterium]
MESGNDKPIDTYSDSVKTLLEEFVASLENVFARRFTKAERVEIEAQLNALQLSSIIKYAQRVEELKTSGDIVQFAKVSNEFMKELIPGIPSNVSGLEHIQKTLFKPTSIKLAYVRESRYSEYLETISKVINDEISSKPNEVRSYLFSVDKVEIDNLAWIQSLTVELHGIIKNLSTDRKRFSRQLATRCISDYSKMSGLYERLIVFVAGFVSIKSPSPTEYIKFRKQSLAKNIDIVRNSRLDILIQDFDKLIRNSIVHKSYKFNPNTGVVDFVDPISGDAESLSYQALFKKTRDLSCLLLVLCQFKGLAESSIIMYLDSLTKANRSD